MHEMAESLNITDILDKYPYSQAWAGISVQNADFADLCADLDRALLQT